MKNSDGVKNELVSVRSQPGWRGWASILHFALSMVLALVSVTLTNQAAAQATSGSWSSGESLWATYCATCHVQVNRADVQNAANAGGHLSYIMAVGKLPSGNPAANLTSQQYNDIAAYIAYYTSNPSYAGVVAYRPVGQSEMDSTPRIFLPPAMAMFTTYGRLSELYIETPPSKGTLTVLAPLPNSRRFSYMPNPGASGRDSFTFYTSRTSLDGGGRTNLRTVLIDIESPLAPSFGDETGADFLVGVAGQMQLRVSGIPQPVVTIDGASPPGIVQTFVTSQSIYYGFQNDVRYAGTPPVGSGGDYPVTVTASNGIGPAVTRNLTLRVSKRPNYISFSPPSQIVIGSGGVPLNATGYSSAPVSYSTNDSTACPLANGAVVPRALGSCQITANQAGDDVYVAAAPATRTIQVIAQPQIISFPSQATRVFNANATFEINPLAVASSGLVVTYESLTLSRCSISGTTVTMLSAGNCTIRASQAGNSRIAAAFADQTIPLNAPPGGGQPRLVTPQLPRAVAGVPYSASLLLAGTLPVLNATVSGLPPGLTATHNGAGSIDITGIPSGDGSYGLLIQASSSAGQILNGVMLDVLNAANYAGNVAQIDGGDGHTCALLSGGVQCWGYNAYGQLGDNSTATSSVGRISIPPGSGATRVSAGDQHTCAVVGSGVQCWGGNASGQLGDGSTTQRLSPVVTIASGSGISDVSAGITHTCAAGAGGLWCWGANNYGQLGTGDTMARTSPTQVIAAGSGVTAVAAGNGFTCAMVSGGVKCWGLNSASQLGDGGAVAQSAVPVTTIASGSGVTALVVGNAHACVVRNAGLQCWGYNYYGQIGNSGGAASTPQQIIAAGSGVTGVAAMRFSTCALVAGGVQCAGENYSGQLGIESNVNSNALIATLPAGSGVTSITGGGTHACVLIAGHVRCWGGSSSGRLGNVALENAWRVPVQAIAAGSGATSVTVNALSSLYSDAAFSGHTCAVVNGGVSCWGNNRIGTLGNNTYDNSAVPVTAIAAGSGATAVTSGADHVCAIVAGAAKCWGSAYKYQLGDNTGSAWPTPRQVVNLTGGVTAIAAGREHTCAVASGGVKCWGDYLYGQLGTGGYNQTLSAVAVSNAPAGSGYTGIAAGDFHSCGLVAGSVRCWGRNHVGQLGTGDTAPSLVPISATQAGAGNSMISADVALNCSVANGGVRCWGANDNFWSGSGQLLADGSNATAVSVGENYLCVIISGGVQCVGANYTGQLGNGSLIESTDLVQVIPVGSGVTAISAGYRHTCAIAGGGVVCWGESIHGQLGTRSVYPYGKHLPAAVQIMFAPQSIVFAPLADRSAASPAFTVAATGGASGNPVMFTAQTPAVCTASGVNGSTITLTGVAGTCSIAANQAGNADYLDAPAVVQSFTAGTPPQYTVTPSAGANGSINPSTPQTVTAGGAMSFTLTPAAGFVAGVGGSCNGVLNGNVYTIGSVQGSCSVSANFTAVPAGAPGAPIVNVASPLPAAARVYFSPPASSGSSAISYYTVTCQPGNVSFSNLTSPIVVQGLTDGVAHTCSVTATNASGTGPASAASNSVVPGTTPAAPVLVGVMSRKTHGATGVFDLSVDTSQPVGGTVSVEPRIIGSGHNIVFLMSSTVNAVGSVTAVDAADVPVGSATASFTGNEVTVVLTGIPDNRRVKIQVNNINGVTTAVAALGFLVGDVNNSRSVNASDIAGVKARSGQTADAGNFKFDFNTSGGINATDIAAVKARAGSVLP